jgi:hypothetical protein
MRRFVSLGLLCGAVVLAGCSGDGSVVLPHSPKATTTSSTTTTTVGQRPQALICASGQVLQSDANGVFRCGSG